MKKFRYIRKHIPSGRIFEDDSAEMSRREFENTLAHWNALGGDMWRYEEKKDLKLRSVVIRRVQTVELRVDTLASTDEEAVEYALSKTTLKYNFVNAKVLETKFTAKAE